MKWIIIFILGTVVGFLLRFWKMKKDNSGFPNAGQITAKKEHLEKILASFSPDDEISNDKVQDMLGVSDATAERYLDELEKSGKLRQIGKTGKHVIYKQI